MSIRSKVNAPRLDQRATLQRQQVVRDPEGRTAVEWVTAETFWCAVDGRKVDQSRREPHRAGQLKDMHDYDVWVRSDVFVRLDVKLSDRILWRNKIFDVVDAPDQQLRGNLIAILCREGSSDG